MRAARAWLMRLFALVSRARDERELRRELESHIELHIEDNLRSGMSEEQARRQALIQLGGIESVKEQCRDASRLTSLETRVRDLRHALRALVRSPVFAFVVVLSLGVAIGSSAAILNLAYRLFSGALPIHEPERVVALYSTQPDMGVGVPLSFLNWSDLRSQSGTLAEVAGYEWSSLPVTLERSTIRVPAQIVSGNYFDTLGVSAATGRLFSESARRFPGASLEVVVGHRFWQQYLGGDPGRVGGSLTIAGQPFTIVGVAPPAFRGIDIGLHVDLWIPFGVYRIFPESDWVWYESRRGDLVYGIGRLADGVSLERARAEISGIASRLEADYPGVNENRGIQAIPVAEATIFPWARPFVRAGVLLLAGAVLLTLLIAAVNVANLFLVRARERGRNVAIQVALGIGRGALASRIFAESLVLSLLGGLAGIWFLWLTQMALKRVVASVPSPTAGAYDLPIELGPSVVAAVFALAVAMGLVLGCFPLLVALRGGSGDALRSRGNTETRVDPSRRFHLREALLVIQLALSFVALLGGALFFRSLEHIRALDPGFEPRRLAFLRLDLSALESERAVAAVVRERLANAVLSLPGVEAVGVSPRRAMNGGWGRPMAPSEAASDPNRRISPYTDRVNGAFFDAMGLAILEGRTFTLEEERDGADVVLLNQELASRLWPSESAVGRTLMLFDLTGDVPLEVIGVVESAKYRRVTESPEGYVYMPLPRDYAGFVTLAMRVSSDPETILRRAEAEVRALEPSIPILTPQTVREVLDQSMWGPRLAAAFLGLFAGIALLLSAVGIYGVISYDVSRRSREFCIRAAVGARRRDILGLVLRHAWKQYLAGILLGVPLAYAASRWVSAMLYVDFLDPYASVGGPFPLLLITLLASWIPARRAAALDPNEVLRGE